MGGCKELDVVERDVGDTVGIVGVAPEHDVAGAGGRFLKEPYKVGGDVAFDADPFADAVGAAGNDDHAERAVASRGAYRQGGAVCILYTTGPSKPVFTIEGDVDGCARIIIFAFVLTGALGQAFGPPLPGQAGMRAQIPLVAVAIEAHHLYTLVPGVGADPHAAALLDDLEVIGVTLEHTRQIQQRTRLSMGSLPMIGRYAGGILFEIFDDDRRVGSLRSGLAGHAGLFSTVADLQVLLDLLLNKGVHKDRRLLSEAVIDTFLTKNAFGHGLGWAMSADVLPADNLPDGSFGHTGFTGTYAVAVPAYGLSIILLTNRQNVGVTASGYYNSVTPLRKRITELMIEAVHHSNGEMR